MAKVAVPPIVLSHFLPRSLNSFPVSGGQVPAVKAYDAYVKGAVVPFSKTCDDLGMGDMGQLVMKAVEGMRTVIVLASRSKLPTEDLATALQPHLQATQEAVKQIRALKLDREWDRHHKAVCEMLGALSWVFMSAPRTLPAPFVKETASSTEFWSNRIRKDYKGKDDQQIAFCDELKKIITGLVEYIDEYHKTGLTFNPRGVSLAEAAIVLSDEPVTQAPPMSPKQKRHPTLGNVVAGGNMAGIMGELSKRKSADGSSAATGLKHVRTNSFRRTLLLESCFVFSPPTLLHLFTGHERTTDMA
jgi:adenylyl cyclase-associated protein